MKIVFGALAAGAAVAVAGIWFAGREMDKVFGDEDWLGFIWG